MKIIGLIGGVNWASTIEYYKYLNIKINKCLGDLNSLECIIYSLNYQEISNNYKSNNLNGTIKMVISACRHLENSGAKAIVLCANNMMHFVADKIQEEISIPIIDAVTLATIEVKRKKLKKVGLIGTKFTMEQDFFKSKLIEAGIKPIIPFIDSDRDFMHTTIINELGSGILKRTTKKKYLSIIRKLEKRGAEGIIAGCAEIPLLIKESDLNIPFFNITRIHTDAALKFALS